MTPVVRTHTFNGKRYLITIAELDGQCDTFQKERELQVFRDPNTRVGLITLIHEALHACNWSKKEEGVDRTSKDIGSFLWRLGFRQVLKESK